MASTNEPVQTLRHEPRWPPAIAILAVLVDIKPDWLFPQTATPEAVPSDWRPFFLDYLFLGYCTATAFSPTDVCR